VAVKDVKEVKAGRIAVNSLEETICVFTLEVKLADARKVSTIG